MEPNRKPEVIYTDNSLEFGKACEDPSWNNCTSTPHRSETKGIAERAVRRVKEGTSAVLLQSGLNESCCPDSMECYTYLRNVTDLLSDGKTPYERRFGQPFQGPIFPFGSLVEYHPISAKDQSRIHVFGKKVLLGLFLGYALYAGGIWKGDVLIADLEELETVDASEVYLRKKTQCNDMVFNELNDSSGSFSYITPSSHQDMDDATLGKLLTEAHRGRADYCDPEGVSVSQSSLSVLFDRAGKPAGERNVDQSIGFGVMRNTYSAYSKFSENTQAEKVVDRSGKPEERNSSNAQIRTLLDEQRQMIIAEYCEKIGHHELQAAHAEEERRILREELWRQQMDFREVHQQSLTEMEELRKFQSATFDTIARR